MNRVSGGSCITQNTPASVSLQCVAFEERSNRSQALQAVSAENELERHSSPRSARPIYTLCRVVCAISSANDAICLNVPCVVSRALLPATHESRSHTHFRPR